MNYRRGKKVSKTFKDYLVPIVIVGILSIFVLQYIFGGEDENQNTQDNVGLQIALIDPNSEAVIEYSGGKETKLEASGEIFSSEKVKVSVGTATLTLLDGVSTLKLNQLGELRYDGEKNFTLFSSDLWVDAQSPLNIDLRYGKVTTTTNSIFSLSQNEIASSLYVLKGTVGIENLAGKQANISAGDKLTLMRDTTKDDKADLALQKETIDETIKSSAWFTVNEGASILQANLASTDPLQASSNTGSTLSLSGTTSPSGNGFSYISFTSHQDEGEVAGSPIDIEGVLNDTSVYRIEINGVVAEINASTMSFIAKGVRLENKMNDVVYKVFDGSSKMLQKGVLTLYNNQGATVGKEDLAQVQNYPISNSSVYKIIAPKENPYTTTSNVVKLEGMVPSRTVKKIVINGFQLQKFPQFGTYWSYFANSDFGNLKQGVNIYKIEYYGADDIVVYESNFTIIKEAPPIAIPPTEGL